MIIKYLKNVLNFSSAGKPPSRRFWAGLRLSVAVTFLSCLLVFALAGIHRTDSQSGAAAIGDDSISRKQVISGNGINPEIESSFPPEDVTMPEKVSGKFMTLLQKTSLIDIFKKGGLIMWPLLFASILAQGTVLERIIFLIGEQRKRDPQAMEAFFSAVGQDDTKRAIQISNKSEFYVVRALGYALSHRERSLASALLYAQEQELKRFRRSIPILDMVITLAPLLGLLGTVTGMMGSFSLIGGELSTPGAITGGIAEALIATAFGLGIAITALVPFNLLNTRMEKARLEIESAATQLELLMHPPAGTVTAVAQASHPGQPVNGKFGHGKRNGLAVRSRMRIPMSFPKG
jgi:biopolymer transport protein ExbB